MSIALAWPELENISSIDASVTIELTYSPLSTSLSSSWTVNMGFLPTIKGYPKTWLDTLLVVEM